MLCEVAGKRACLPHEWRRTGLHCSELSTLPSTFAVLGFGRFSQRLRRRNKPLRQARWTSQPCPLLHVYKVIPALVCTDVSGNYREIPPHAYARIRERPSQRLIPAAPLRAHSARFGSRIPGRPLHWLRHRSLAAAPHATPTPASSTCACPLQHSSRLKCRAPAHRASTATATLSPIKPPTISQLCGINRFPNVARLIGSSLRLT
jgi:hypothetical protein